MKKLIARNISIICAICLIICMAGGFTSGNIISTNAAAIAGSTDKPGVITINNATIPVDEVSASTVAMFINGIRMTDGVKIKDTTYVPLRAFFDVIGDQTDIAWDADTNTVTVTGKDLELKATVGTKYMTVNGRCFYLPDGVLVINDQLSLPVRELAKVYQVDVSWDSENSAVSLTADDPSLLESGDSFYKEEDLYWLSRLINAEAGNQTLEGKIGVGNVVINRLADPTCPKTIYGVIFDNKYGVQFSVTEGSIYEEPNEESVIAAKICLEGYKLVGDSIYFVNPQVGVSSWFAQTRVFVTNIGDHDFYA